VPFSQPDRSPTSMHGSFEIDEENLFLEAAKWAEGSKTAEMVAAYHASCLSSSRIIG